MKKIIGILIACTLLFSIIQLPAVAASGASGDEYVLLKDLGILKDEEFDFSHQLTVPELARILVMLSSRGNAEVTDDFTSAAKDLGLLPADIKEPVSLDTAAALIVRGTFWMLCRGKTDAEVVDFGLSHGLFRNLNTADSTAITLEDAAVMVRNLLDMDSVIIEGDTYTTDSKSVLEKYFDITVKDGVLYTGKMRELSDKYVIIDGESYSTDKDYSKYAGYKVRAYINGERLVSVDASKFRNDVYVISANDIDSVGTDSITFYETRNRTVRKIIASDAEEVYNGRLTEFKSEDMDISGGFVTLIRHPGSSYYNVVIIKQYDMMVAGGIGNNIVYDYNNLGINVRLHESDVETTITMNGEKAEASDIKKYDVLLISYTKNRDAVQIEIVRNTVSGTVKASGNDTIQIDRKTYLKTAYFKQYGKTVEIGSEAELILDGTGLAVGIKTGTNSDKYGYFMGMYVDETDDDRWVHMFTSEGKFENIKLRDKLTLNGALAESTGTYANELDRAFKTLVECDINGNKSERVVNDYVYQVIIYRTNEQGEINYIDTAIEEPDKDADKQLTLDGYVNENKRFKGGSCQFVDSFGMVSGVTTIFRVPITDNVFDDAGNLDTEKRELANRNKHYEIVAPSYIKNDEDKATASAYSISRGGVAKAVVLYNKDLEATEGFNELSAPLFIVTKITKGINADEERCHILEGTENGQKKTYYIKEENFGREEGKSGSTVFVTPKVHDIMQIKADNDGNVISYTTRYDGAKNINYYDYVGNDVWWPMCCIAGFVYDKDEYGFVTVSDVESRSDMRIIMNKGVYTVYVYDMQDRTVSKGSLNDLVAYMDIEYKPSRIFATASYGVVHTVIIYVNDILYGNEEEK